MGRRVVVLAGAVVGVASTVVVVSVVVVNFTGLRNLLRSSF